MKEILKEREGGVRGGYIEGEILRGRERERERLREREVERDRLRERTREREEKESEGGREFSRKRD